MRRAAPLVGLLALAALAGAPATSAEEKFAVAAAVDPRTGLTDTEPISLVITIEGSDRPDVATPRLPAMRNLRVVSGPSVSTQTSFEIVNFQARQTSRVTLAYTLMADKPGAAEIPSIALTVSGSVYRTAPIRLDVGIGPTGPAPPGTARAAPDAEAGEGGEMFLRASLSRAEVYAGEPVVLEVTLYTRWQFSELRWTQLAPLAGFWSEDIRVDAEAEARREEIEGATYVAYPLLRKILVPTVAGPAGIEPYAVEVSVPVRSRDPIADFFGRRARPVLRKSRPVALDVKPLPEAGKPASFGGAVGTFKVTVAADRAEARVNDAVALKVVVEGEGSLQGVPAPHLDPPADLKVYDPKSDESTVVRAGRLVSRKSWEWVVVPLAPGAMTIPPVRFAYFDPKAGAYREIGADPIALTVRRGEAPETPTARTEVRAQRREVGWIKTGGGSLATGASPLHARPLGIALLVAPLAGLPLAVAWGRRRARLRGDRGLVRARRAAARARRGLREAERMLSSADAEAFHGRAGRALVEYVADRFDRSAEGLTYDVAEDLLAARGVDPEIRRRFRACLEACDFARFVPGAGDTARREQTLREARAVVDLLEKAS